MAFINKFSPRNTQFVIKPVHQYLLLLLITCLAAILRLYKLGEWSLWGDEISGLNFSQNINNVPLERWSLSPVLTHLAINALGVSEWSARFAPAMIGVITLPILFFPVRKLFGTNVALLSTLLLALSTWHLYWSQNVRFYTSLLLLSTLALLAFFISIEDNRPIYSVISLIFLEMAYQERLLAYFIPIIAFAYILCILILPFNKPPGFRLLNIGLFFGPIVIIAIIIGLPIIGDPADWFNSFGWINNNPFWILAGVMYYLGLPTVIMAIFGLIYLLLKKNRPALFLGLAAVIPLLSVLGFSIFQYSANRYIFVSLISWIVFASVGIEQLIFQTKGSSKLIAIGVLAILVITPLSENVLYYQYQNGNRDDWKAAFELLRREKKLEDQVVTPDPALAAYYLQEETIGFPGLDFDQFVQTSNQRIWFVENMDVEEKWPEAHRWITENASLIANFDVHVRARNFKMRVYLYDP